MPPPTHTPQAGRREAIWSQTSSSPVIAELQSSLFAGSHLTFSPVLSWRPRCATLPLLPEQTEGAHPAQQHKPKPCSVRTRAGSAAAKENSPRLGSQQPQREWLTMVQPPQPERWPLPHAQDDFANVSPSLPETEVTFCLQMTRKNSQVPQPEVRHSLLCGPEESTSLSGPDRHLHPSQL